MIKTKEDLLGTKVRYEGENQWGMIKIVCNTLGIEHGKWTGCNHFTGNCVALISHSGMSNSHEKFISVGEGSWEDDDETSHQFKDLREIQFSEFEEYLGIKPPTPKYKYTPLEVESVFDLKEMFEKGEIYFRWCGNGEEGSGGVGYDKITTENMLICRYEEGRLLKREEVKLEPKGGEWWYCALSQSGFGKNTVVYRATDKVWSLPDESWGVVWKQEDVTPKYKMVKEEDK